MKQQRIFYKVFIQKDDALCSTSSKISPKLGVVYNTDEYITAPGNTRFFLFPTYEEARSFVKGEHSHTVQFVIKAVHVKGSYAKNCLGMRISYRNSTPITIKMRQEYRAKFWDVVEELTTTKKMSMAKACLRAVNIISVPTGLMIVNTPYYSVFARHIKILDIPVD